MNIRIRLFIALCIFQFVKVSGQNILNQYNNKGCKNGLWFEDEGRFVTNYKNGKKDGIGYQLKRNGAITAIYEYDNGSIVRIIYFDDLQRLSFIMTDFVDVDTIVHGKELSHHFAKRFKTICYHPNGVIKSITNDYLKDGGSPEIDSFEIGKAYYYDDKGNLIETKELFFPKF